MSIAWRELMIDLVKEAIIQANRLGFKGMKVVGYMEPESATDNPELRLIIFCTLPENKTASGNDYDD